MSSRSMILSEMQKVADEQEVKLAPLSDDLILIESGLDSLCLAILVSRLEDTLGIDPFSSSDEVPLPVTLGDFVKAYDNAARPA